jgi:hypothetical protein
MTILFDFAVDKAQPGNAWAGPFLCSGIPATSIADAGGIIPIIFFATPMGESANCIVERRVLESIALHRSK